MAARKITVVISQGQSNNPVKRELEESLATAMIMDDQIDVSLVPHLYDMTPDHTGMLFLRSVPGDLVVLSWLYPRAARWTLDRAGVKGHAGQTLLTVDDDDDPTEDSGDDTEANAGIGPVDVPNRKLYCLSLQSSEDPQDYLDEIRRIVSENSVQTVDLMDWIQGNPKEDQLQRYLRPEAMLSANTDGASGADLPEKTKRRWYPVIDYERCTNCMECIDFCLFGVYGVDALDRILVEEQDNCKKGCPVCSRVCPENAIVFPQHKSPAIAGAAGEVAGLKIDLSKLFGGDEGESPLDMAIAERDKELVADGREAVGASIGLPRRQAGGSSQPRDDLDDLIDGLDDMDL